MQMRLVVHERGARRLETGKQKVASLDNTSWGSKALEGEVNVKEASQQHTGIQSTREIENILANKVKDTIYQKDVFFLVCNLLVPSSSCLSHPHRSLIDTLHYDRAASGAFPPALSCSRGEPRFSF